MRIEFMIMSAFEAATLLLFPSLGLVALAIGLLARRYSRAALAVGLTGLLALTAVSTWITVAGPAIGRVPAVSTSPHQPNPATERALEPGSPLPQPDLPTAVAKRLEQELRSEQERRADAERKAADGGRTVSELTGQLREAQGGKAVVELKVADLEKRLRDLQSAPAAPTFPDLPSIRRKLSDGDPRHYTTEEERALIPGRTGSWHVIRLLQDGSEWSFDDRQFVLADPTKIKASAARLRDEILLPLSQAETKWKLYVRGSADARPVAGEVGRDVIYLPRSVNGMYSLEPKRKRVALPVQNEYLPSLRAEWLREIVRPVLGTIGTGDIEILENPPQPGHGRTADLVLFVER